jgi:hypothetical protein
MPPEACRGSIASVKAVKTHSGAPSLGQRLNNTKLLVEIGLEGGLQHNSPLKSLALLQRGHDQGPLRRRTELSSENSLIAKLANSTLLLLLLLLDLLLLLLLLCYSRSEQNTQTECVGIDLEPSQISCH